MQRRTKDIFKLFNLRCCWCFKMMLKRLIPISGLIEKSEKVRGLLDLDLVTLGLEEHPDIYKFLGPNSLTDENFLSVLPCKTFKRAANDTDFLLEQNEKVLETITFFSNISLENGNKTDFFECLGKRNARKLLGNRTVVKHLPLRLVVKIVNEKCCKFFDEKTTDSALIAHPTLPFYMNDRALRYDTFLHTFLQSVNNSAPKGPLTSLKSYWVKLFYFCIDFFEERFKREGNSLTQ